MLILIAGVSGNLGKYLAEDAISKGHKVRGFGRSPSKLPPSLLEQFESFIQCEDYGDRIALGKAVSGADAVICSYSSHAESILDSQLSLIRAVERAGVKVYHAHSWNSDWTKIRFGEFEHYDAIELTSSVKPVYSFTGILGEFALNEMAGIAHLKEDENGRYLAHWGNGDAKWDFTYLSDMARYTIDLITTNKSVLAGEGGFYRAHSAAATARDIAEAYEKVTGQKIRLKSLGGTKELDDNLEQGRATMDASRYFLYSHYFIQAAAIRGKWALDDPIAVGGPDAIERLFDSQMETPADYQ